MCRKNLPNNTVGALPELFGHVVSFIDNEVLIKDFEVLPTLQFPHYVIWEWKIKDDSRIWQIRLTRPRIAANIDCVEAGWYNGENRVNCSGAPAEMAGCAVCIWR